MSGMISTLRMGALLSLALIAGCAKGYTLDDVDAEVEEPPPRIPSRIRTYVPNPKVFAGDRLFTSCDVYDEQGLLISPEELAADGATPEILYDPQSLLRKQKGEDAGEDAEEQIIAERVGFVYASCTLSQFGLYDDPVRIEIVPSTPFSAVTLLESDQIMAGESTTAICRVFDRFGNEIEEAASELSVSPSGGGVATDALRVVATRSDIYEVTCSVPGATDVESDFLRVDPALPHSMSVGLRPDRRFYRLEDQVLVATDVRDRFGNRVTGATINFHSSGTPSEILRNAERFTFKSDGSYTIHAEVSSPIDPEVSEVRGQVEVTVNTTGPDIDCLRHDNFASSEAYMTRTAPGATVQIPVDIADTFGVSEVRINGALASHNGSGRYTAPHIVSWGMNFVDIVAKDELGEDNSKTCFFLASDRWSGANSIQRNTIGFRLNQAAFGPRQGGSSLTTFEDIIYRVANSNGLVNQLDGALTSMGNPLYDECLQRICPCFGGCCFCAARARVSYNSGSLSIGGPNVATLRLVPNGLRVGMSLRNFGGRFNVGGTCSGNPQISISELSADLTLGLSVSGNALRATVQTVHNASINGLSIGCQFSFPCNLICSIFNGPIRNAVRNALQGQMESILKDQIGPLLDSLLSGLDIATLAADFSIPKIDNSGAVSLSFGTSLDYGSFTAQRVLLGLGARFSLTSGSPHNRATEGAIHRAAPDPGTPVDPPVAPGNTVAVSFYEGAINQVLHNLWMGGFFTLSLNLGDGGAVSPSVSIDAFLPPVAHISNEGGSERVRLMMGGIDAEVRIPPLIDEPPLRVMFGGVATAQASLNGDALRVHNLALDYENDLHISFEDAISHEGRMAVRDLLGDILVNLLETAVNEGLPAIPIPSFELPAALSMYDLPVGAHLRVLSPSLVLQGNHFRLSGGFGVQ